MRRLAERIGIAVVSAGITVGAMNMNESTKSIPESDGNWKKFPVKAENVRMSFDTEKGRVELKMDGSRELVYRLLTPIK